VSVRRSRAIPGARTSDVEAAGGSDTAYRVPGADRGSRGEDRWGCWPAARDLEVRRQTSGSGCARLQA
jgi:hypothetical protein